MADKRYVVAYGEPADQAVARAPENESGDFLTKSEAAIRIIKAMDGLCYQARESRRKAERILIAERKKAVQP